MALTDAVTGAVSALSGTGVPVSFKLPMPNVLSGFASYTSLFSLHCLSTDQFNFPLQSYRAGKLPPTICSSAFRDPTNRFGTVSEKFDFFITDVNLVGQYGFEKGTGNTNVHSAEFTVIEPYSIGTFMIMMQAAAQNAGYKNYNDAPFLLVIQFRGNTESGQMVNIPLTTKYITCKLNNISMKVTEAGATYTVSTTSWNSAALLDSVKLITNTFNISGKTVQEVLQTGTNSLQKAINAKYKEQKNAGAVSVTDEILILFPSKIGSGPVTLPAEDKKLTADSGTNSTTSADNGRLLNELGVIRNGQTTLLEQKAGCNVIGLAKVGFDLTREGNRRVPDATRVWDAKGKVWSKGDAPIAPDDISFQFQANSDIPSIINQVILKSQYAVDVMDKGKIDQGNGMRPWFRIDTQVYHINTPANMKTTGTTPKLYVYRVVEYLVHSSRFAAPNTPMLGKPGLTNQVAKVYNYLYTGLNTEVRTFELMFENSFYKAFLSDNGTNANGKTNQGRNAVTAKTTGTQLVSVSGGTPPTVPGQETSQAKNNLVRVPTDRNGGNTFADLDPQRIAATLHNALLDGTTDMTNVTVVINGDPYYIANSGAGNYTADESNKLNVTKDGDVSYQKSEVDVIMNFRTPSDIVQSTGLYNRKSNLCAQFSGFYWLTTVESKFSNGDFSQTLHMTRRSGQDFLGVDMNGFPTNKTKTTVTKTDGTTTTMTVDEVRAARDRGEIEE
jgi:hypothetical protein